MAGTSIVEYFGDGGGHRCGYCGKSDSNESHGMWAHKMSCQDYQDLIDRGWRRSGKYVYKPQMSKTCCPPYPIRCDALQFKISKSQKKVLKKMTRFLTVPESETHSQSAKSGEEKTTHSNVAMDAHERDQSESTSPGVGADPNRPRCRKAKQIRWEQKQQKQQKLAKLHGETSVSDDGEVAQNSKDQEGKSLEDLMVDCLPDKNPVHRLEIKLVQSDLGIQEFSGSFGESAELFFKYQRMIHQDPPEKCTEKRVKLVRVDMNSAEFRTYFEKSHKVFEKYQIAVHRDQKDECDENQYKRFLVDSPLVHQKSADAPADGYGSYHQQYYLDGKLIAVGVLDLLRSCVSSVYFFYDPDYSFLSLGVYSALRELTLTRQLQQQSPNLTHYYMGFYIHSCPKMRYKGQYFPSYLVCPETYEWVPIEKCQPKLDVSKYSRLSDNPLDPPKTDIDSVMILYQRNAMPYQIFKVFSRREDGEDSEAEVEEYANLVGPVVAPRMLLFRS